jgi:hypothetical protein
MNTDPITRLIFIQNMVEGGLTYDQATRAYNSVMSTIADGVVNKRRIYLGQVGVMNPTVLPPRTIKMGCVMTKGRKVVKQQREFYLDSRVKYSFRMFKKFARTHELKWAC